MEPAAAGSGDATSAGEACLWQASWLRFSDASAPSPPPCLWHCCALCLCQPLSLCPCLSWQVCFCLGHLALMQLLFLGISFSFFLFKLFQIQLVCILIIQTAHQIFQVTVQNIILAGSSLEGIYHPHCTENSPSNIVAAQPCNQLARQP